MATKRNVIVYALIGSVSALITGIFYSWPDAPHSRADDAVNSSDWQSKLSEPGDGINAVDSSAETDVRVTSANDSATTSSARTGEDAIGTAANRFNSFEDFMSQPGARAESYVLVEGALRIDRLREFKSPELFDSFAAALTESGDAESQEMAATIMQKFAAAANQSSRPVTVRSVSCGGSICTAQFQSPDTAVLDEYMTSVLQFADVPMYASVQMPAQANIGFDVRRIIFTTDPTANAIETVVSE